MAFLLGVRSVSYGVVGAAAILTHETTKAYKGRLYNWALEKLSKSRSSQPQSQETKPNYRTTDQHSLNDGAHLAVPQLQQLITATGENGDAHLAVPQIQQLAAAAGENDDDARLAVPQIQQLTATGENDDGAHLSVLNDDHTVKSSHLIDKELEASFETSEDHGAVKIVGGAKHEESQAPPPRSPPLPGRGAFSFSKAFNFLKSQAHGLSCWARGLFEGKREATVRIMIARIVSRIFWLITDAVFHEKFKPRNKVLQQIIRIIINELKAAQVII